MTVAEAGAPGQFACGTAGVLPALRNGLAHRRRGHQATDNGRLAVTHRHRSWVGGVRVLGRSRPRSGVTWSQPTVLQCRDGIRRRSRSSPVDPSARRSPSPSREQQWHFL